MIYELYLFELFSNALVNLYSIFIKFIVLLSNFCLLKLSRLGVTILPPEPAFYNKPESVSDIVDHIVARICDQFGINNELTKRWNGQMKSEDVVPLRR